MDALYYSGLLYSCILANRIIYSNYRIIFSIIYVRYIFPYLILLFIYCVIYLSVPIISWFLMSINISKLSKKSVKKLWYFQKLKVWLFKFSKTVSILLFRWLKCKRSSIQWKSWRLYFGSIARMISCVIISFSIICGFWAKFFRASLELHSVANSLPCF